METLGREKVKGGPDVDPKYQDPQWLLKLWSLFGYPKYLVPYYIRDPKKGP